MVNSSTSAKDLKFYALPIDQLPLTFTFSLQQLFVSLLLGLSNNIVSYRLASAELCLQRAFYTNCSNRMWGEGVGMSRACPVHTRKGIDTNNK